MATRTIQPAIPIEKYQLICCGTDQVLLINNLPAVFLFSGDYKNGHHPDTFYDIVLTSIKDINGNVITGCFKLADAICYVESEDILWEDMFIDVACVKTCFDCLPAPVYVPPITNPKFIYPEYTVNNVDAFDAEKIYCSFGDAKYQKALSLKYGIEFCCPVDLIQSTIEHEILKMDISEDTTACKPGTLIPSSCKKYIITIPKLKEGVLYFKDCNNIVRTVIVYAATNAYETTVCGITGQTASDIYMLSSNLSEIINLSFTEDVDCN